MSGVIAGCEAIFWEHCGEPTAGWPALGVGDYSAADLHSKGLRINGVSDLTFNGADDCQVRLYDGDHFQGELNPKP